MNHLAYQLPVYIRKCIKPGPCTIFGAPSCLAEVIRALRSSGFDPRYCCDNNSNKHSQIVEGVEIVAPTPDIFSSTPILVASSPHYENIVDQLRDMGVGDTNLLASLFESRAPSELLEDWRDSELTLPNEESLPQSMKWHRRQERMAVVWKRLHKWIPEYLDGKNLSFLDVGAGNGAALEVVRFYEHHGLGIDYDPNREKGDWQLRRFIESQELAVLNYDASNPPFPLSSKSFDVVICYACMKALKPLSNWPGILDEYARLARKGIFIGVTSVPGFDDYDEAVEILTSWDAPGFKLVEQEVGLCKWQATA